MVNPEMKHDSDQEDDFEKLWDRGERAGKPPMYRSELERVSVMVQSIQRLVSSDYYMISFDQLGFVLPDDAAEFIPKALEILQNGGCIFSILEHDVSWLWFS